MQIAFVLMLSVRFIFYVWSDNTLQHSSNETIHHQEYDDHPKSKPNTITKSTLQAELSRAFKKFLSSVAFSVPKGVVGKFVSTLRKIGLPIRAAALTQCNEIISSERCLQLVAHNDEGLIQVSAMNV